MGDKDEHFNWETGEFSTRERTAYHPYRHAIRGFIDLATAGLTSRLPSLPESEWGPWVPTGVFSQAHLNAQANERLVRRNSQR